MDHILRMQICQSVRYLADILLSVSAAYLRDHYATHPAAPALREATLLRQPLVHFPLTRQLEHQENAIGVVEPSV